jgi:hypothetical protein
MAAGKSEAVASLGREHFELFGIQSKIDNDRPRGRRRTLFGPEIVVDVHYQAFAFDAQMFPFVNGQSRIVRFIVDAV